VAEHERSILAEEKLEIEKRGSTAVLLASCKNTRIRMMIRCKPFLKAEGKTHRIIVCWMRIEQI
jgi:hypothetical protein